MTGSKGTKTAFVDESIRTSPTGGFYLVAAAIVPSTARSAMEREVRASLGRRRHRVHWHNESEKVRLGFLDVIAVMAIRGVAVAARSPVPRRQEKARETALWSLAPRLEELGVTELVFESRQERLNRRDGRTMGSLQRSGLAVGMSHWFGRPSDEALLWVADALAGTAAASLGGEEHYLRRLPSGLLAVHDL